MVYIVAGGIECKRSHREAAHRKTIPFEAGFYAVCGRSQLVARRCSSLPPFVGEGGRAKLGRMRGAPAWHRRRSFQHTSTVLALRADPPSPTGGEGKAVPLALYKSGARKYERPRLFWLALRQPRYVLHDERGTLNSERTRCPTSKGSFLRWHKRWKNAAMPS
ncbi:hypothetical protein FJ930_14215 [Mesorhizobium sp. B2-4-15]|nr:hypothetical protein FJ930_14215 [Mesorhizobium sp. B2-4-15]